MVKKTLFILFMAVLVVSLLVGCGGGGETVTPIELVPQKANMIGLIDLSQIISDEDIAELWEAMPLEPDMPQTLDEALDLAMEESGLDLTDFEEGLMFGEVSEATGDMDYFGIIVKGTFEESDLIASIESGMDEEFTTVSYQGYEIYTDPYEEMGLAFLGSDALVIGSMDAVKDVIEVEEGDQSAISGKLLNTYNGLGDALIKVAMIVPPGAIEEGLQEIMGEFPIPLPGLDKLADMDTVGMTLTKNGQSISLVSRMCFTSSDSAEAVEGLINAAMLFAGLMPDIPEEALELLGNLEVSISGSCLDISLEMTMSEVETLIPNITNIAGFTTGRGGAEAFETDQEVIQLATATFYSDVHGGWVKGPPALWGCSNTAVAEGPGHYYPTAIAEVGNHVITLSTTVYDNENPNNYRLDGAAGAATATEIVDHAIWMGLLVNYSGVYATTAGTSARGEVSVLEGETCLYLQEIPESASTMNGAPLPGGTYTWIVGKYGAVYGAYQETDGNWYSGFNGTYP